MRYLCLLLLATLCTTSKTFAQQTLKARVFEVSTRVPLAGIHIENMRTKKTTESDIAGRFNIQVALNDVLVLKGFAYETDTIVVLKLTESEFFMLPRQNLLNEVKVQNQQVVGSFKVYDRDFHNQSMQYAMDKNGNYKGGVTFRIWSNKAEERKRKKLEGLEFRYRWEPVIDSAFGVKNLAQFIPLKGRELEAFSFMYRPSVKQYTAYNFNLLAYINLCYKKFMSISPEKRKASPLKP